ncbi:hypothetical protein [Mesorhizobium sp. M0701]|uniref:hypothetical protein n=1 Tax=Mesorhizobium sp. M0701 TaxID=2956989 RepID=UPI00333AA9AB
MNAFAAMLAEMIEAYIALRRALGYAFQKQAATLRALARYVKAEQLDSPLTPDMVLNFVLSGDGTANGRPIRHGVIRRFCEYLAAMTRGPSRLTPGALPRYRAIPLPRIKTRNSVRSCWRAGEFCRNIPSGAWC